MARTGLQTWIAFSAFGLTASSERAYFYITLSRGCDRLHGTFACEPLTDRSRVASPPRRHARRPGDEHSDNKLKLMAVGRWCRCRRTCGDDQLRAAAGCVPDDYNTQVLIVIYAMVILGGAGSLVGAVLGAFS